MMETMPNRIPDPRRFSDARPSPLGEAANEIVAASPDAQTRLLSRLSQRLSDMLRQGEEKGIREALRQPASASACRALQQALELALAPNVGDGGVHVRVFAIPVLFVVGAPTAARVDGVVADAGAIRALFETAGTLGHCRNFGLSNALADLGSVENISWPTLYAITHAEQWHGLAGLDLPPADIAVTANQESVHLRFLVGAALTPGDAPGFVESAGDIGRWGMSLTQLLGRQLATQDVSLLAIPRPPRGIVHAAREGWHAAREMGFELFLSNALRQARLRTGEPDVTIAAGSDNSIRIHLTSPFDDMFDQTYIWPLAASDGFDTIVNSIFALLNEARADRIEVQSAIETISEANVVPH
jgi:hypothetical protein